MALYRSNRNSMIAGVCGGIAESLGWSAGRVRFLYVLISVLSAGFPGTVAYVLLWLIVPRAPR